MKRFGEDSETSKKLKTSKAYLDFSDGKTTFESFIKTDGISLEMFMNDYWDKKPLLIKRNDNENWLNYIKDLFSLDILKSILEKEKIKYETDINLCKLVNGTKSVLNKKGQAKLAHVIDSFEKNKATIQFHQPQRFSDELWYLMEKFECFFGNLVGANIYITPNDSQGLPPHHDDINAFVIQLEGKKHWLLYEPSTKLPNDYCLVKDKKYIEKPILDVILEPGDILFFQRGIIHQANTPDLLSLGGECSYSTHVTISTYQNFNRMEYLISTIGFALRNSFKENLTLREGLPLDFFRKTNFEEYLKKSIESINFNQNDCYPVYLLKDFMSSRLPPYDSNINEETNFEFLKEIQNLDEKLKFRIKHTEHVLIAIQSEKNEDYEDEEDEEDDNKLEIKDDNYYKLLIFNSAKNLRKNHMMTKNSKTANLTQNCLKVDVGCKNIMELLINNEDKKWYNLKELKNILQDSISDNERVDTILRSLLISLNVENILDIQLETN